MSSPRDASSLVTLTALLTLKDRMENVEELAFVCFRDVAWLQTYPLTADNVLEYFSLSQFYDRTCNNEVLKMQACFTDNASLLSRLHTMTGVEYAVARAIAPKLFIITKQNRYSHHKAVVSDCYYILDGSIFMAPTLYAVLRMRLTSSMHYLGAALSYARKHIFFDANTYQYQVDADSSAEKEYQDPTVQNEIDLIISEAIANSEKG